MNEARALLERAERGPRRGPDLVWAAAQRRHRPHSFLVGAALVLFVVVAVAALSLAVAHTGDSTPPYATTPPTESPDTTEVTASATGAQIATSVSITGPELGRGSTVAVHATLTNVSTEPVRVNVEPQDLLSIWWEVMPARLLEPAHALGITALDAGRVAFRRLDQSNDFRSPEDIVQHSTATLAPGETATIEALVDIDEQVHTGSVTLRFIPLVLVDSPNGELHQHPDDARLDLPLTVLPNDDGTVSDADAEVLALAHPAVDQWLHSSPGGWPGLTVPGTVNFTGTFPTADGWQVIVGIQSEDATGEPADNVRALGLCGFIVNVSRQGAVTVDYLNLGPGS